MATADLEALLVRMPDIAKAVNTFTSEVVQQAAFDALIAAFAGNALKKGDTKLASPAAEESEGSESIKSSKRQRKLSRKPRTSEQSGSDDGFDEIGLANSIRDDPRFDLFKAKIILGTPSKQQLVQFVSWFAGEIPLTSGNMRRVLEHLGIRMSAPEASTAVSKAKNDYIATPGSRPQTFRLTSRAHNDYEKWILNDVKAG